MGKVAEGEDKIMRHGSLFSGIGGFDLAAEWMGWENVFHCEWNLYGQIVLKHHWPSAESFSDITKTDFKKYANRINVLSGGFPCQPFSVAGEGLGTEDERHLWPEMFRAIREIQPPWVVGENVPGIITNGCGVVFEQVQADLEAEGYEIIPFEIPACGKNAPHKRNRVWFVAYNQESGRNRQQPVVNEWKEFKQERRRIRNRIGSIGGQRIITNTKNNRLAFTGSTRQRWSGFTNRNKRITSHSNVFRHAQEKHRGQKSGFIAGQSGFDYWQNFPTQPPVCSRDDGFRSEPLRDFIRKDCNGLLSEKEIDTIISKADSKFREVQIEAFGNAIVPQIAFEIFNAIQKFEDLKQNARTPNTRTP